MKKLKWQDVRILANDSFFEEMDAKRKTSQALKDFINDQDSTSGPGVVDNMIQNILCVRSGTFALDSSFGTALDSLLFESLTWDNLEFARTIIFNDLSLQLPNNVTVTHIELKTDDEHSTLYIEVNYNIRLSEDDITYQQPGPQTIGDRVAYFNIDLKGVVGSNQNIFTNA